MNEFAQILTKIYFENDGEIDLLTGAIAPARFNQIVKREIDLSKRSKGKLAIISIVLPSQNLIKNITIESDINQQALIVEESLIELHFKIKRDLREVDCICRVSKLGFWILAKIAAESDSQILVERVKALIPQESSVSVINYTPGDLQLQWYEKIDQQHFKQK